MMLALMGLVTGVLAGLYRIGWSLPVSAIGPDHGAIMIGGFLGTLITLEKIIPLKKSMLYGIPMLSAASVVFFFFDLPAYSVGCLVAASTGLSMVFLIYWIRTRSMIYAVMFMGAICWLTGNIFLLLHNFYPVALPWWMAFALFTIAAERLELMAFLPVSQKQKLILFLLLGIFLTGCISSFHGTGSYLAAFSLAGVSLWLMQHDVVGINLKKENLTKFTGIALLSGYCALLLSGLFIFLLTDQPLGYDILVHSFFIGFVFSMIFAHGPIILPGVLGLTVKPFHPILYVWLIGLHGSWVYRVVACITLDLQGRKFSGLISSLAIAGYFLSIVTVTIRRYREKAV